MSIEADHRSAAPLDAAVKCMPTGSDPSAPPTDLAQSAWLALQAYVASSDYAYQMPSTAMNSDTTNNVDPSALDLLRAAGIAAGGQSNLSSVPTPPITGKAANQPFAPRNTMINYAASASPFESPLGVSSVGSPNSSRDFDDSPLIPLEDDFGTSATPFDEHGVFFGDRPLFDFGRSVTPAQQSNVDASAMTAPSGDQAWPSSFNYADFVGTAANANGSATVEQLSLSKDTSSGASTFDGVPSVSVDPMPHLFATLRGIAPQQVTTLPVGADSNIGFTANVRRLSLSDSVSGYSSSQESTAPIASQSTAGTPSSIDSRSASPSSQCERRTLAETVADLVREYSRGRDERETTTLVSALNQVGIPIDHAILDEVRSNASQSPPANLASPPHSSRSCSPGEHHSHFVPLASGHREQSTEGFSIDALFSGIQHQQAQHLHQHQHQHQNASKTRSSVQTTAKHTAVGTNATTALEDGEVFYVNGKRWFRCTVCNKHFDRHFNLKTHRTIHQEQREYPFACPFEGCGKAFSRKADCNRHTRSVHLKKGQKLRPGQGLSVDLG